MNRSYCKKKNWIVKIIEHMSLTDAMRKCHCDEVEGEAFNMTGESIPLSELKPLLLDRSMLEALGGPGERSILSQKKRSGVGGEQKDGMEEESREDDKAEEDVKRDEDEAERDEDRTSSEENSEEEDERGEPIVVFFNYFFFFNGSSSQSDPR